MRTAHKPQLREIPSSHLSKRGVRFGTPDSEFSIELVSPESFRACCRDWLCKFVPAHQSDGIARKLKNSSRNPLHATPCCLKRQISFTHTRRFAVRLTTYPTNFPNSITSMKPGCFTGTCQSDGTLFFAELYPNVMDRRLMLDLRTSVTTALGV